MKNDIKYIIKKIIIGVGIATGIMLVKSLPVFAEEKKDIAICQAGRNSGMTWFSQQNDCSKYLSGAGNIPDSSFTEIVSYDFPFYTSATFHFKYEVSTKRNQLIFYDEKNDTYMIIGISSKYKEVKIVSAVNGANKPYYYFMGRTSASESFSRLNYSSLVVVTSKSHTMYEDLYELNKTNASGDNFFEKQIYENGNDKIYIYGAQLIDISSLYLSYSELDYGLSILDLKNNKLISSGFDKVYFGDDIKDVEEIGGVPKNYEEINMKDKYAVVFYPKDVRNLEKKCTKTEDVYETDDEGNVSIVKKCVEESYVTTFWHNGNFNILNSDIQNMNYVEHPVTSNAMNELFEETLFFNTNEFKNSIIFYNNAQNQNTDSDGNVSVIDYGGNGVIYYDPSLFNYFFIEKPDSEVNEDISFIDKDGNEQNVHVDTLPKQDAYVDFNLGFDEETINKFDVVSAFKSFINMISDGASFFKKYISLFLKNVPDFVYYFIIFIPILSIIIAVLKIVNNR